MIGLDPPASVEDYVHRVGRTSRMLAFDSHASGASLIFVSPKEKGFISVLRRLLLTRAEGKGSRPVISALSLVNLCAHQVSQKKSGRYLKYHHPEELLLYDLDQRLHSLVVSSRLEPLAESAVRSFLRAYPCRRDASLRRYFKLSDLHLGHVRRSFACPGAFTRPPS